MKALSPIACFLRVDGRISLDCEIRSRSRCAYLKAGHVRCPRVTKSEVYMVYLIIPYSRATRLSWTSIITLQLD